MKKIFVCLTSTVLLCSTMIINSKTNGFNPLQMENVEALASGENGGGNVNCYFSGSVDCPINHSKVYSVHVLSHEY